MTKTIDISSIYIHMYTKIDMCMCVPMASKSAGGILMKFLGNIQISPGGNRVKFHSDRKFKRTRRVLLVDS